MRQSTMRKWHRWIGIAIALFIFFQAGSGMLITGSEFDGSPAHNEGDHQHDDTAVEKSSVWHEFLEGVHHGGGNLMNLYRLLLGIGILAQTVIGLMIFIGLKRRRTAS